MVCIMVGVVDHVDHWDQTCGRGALPETPGHYEPISPVEESRKLYSRETLELTSLLEVLDHSYLQHRHLYLEEHNLLLDLVT